MAVTRKPAKKEAAPAQPNESQVMELIEKGGSIAQEPKRESVRKVVQVFFRAPGHIIEQVEAAVKGRILPTTRQNWLLEAILEKLEREAKS
jgi:hypothetical protein